jgi:hypothetical protein
MVAVRLEGPMGVMDSLAETDSRAAQQAEARMQVKPSREIPVTMAGDRRSQKLTEEGTPQKDHGARDEQH